MNLAGMLDRTIKPYILILTLIFAASFLAGTVAPPSVRRQMTEVFQVSSATIGGLPGGRSSSTSSFKM